MTMYDDTLNISENQQSTQFSGCGSKLGAVTAAMCEGVTAWFHLV